MSNINLIATNFEDIKKTIINKYKNDPDSPFLDYDFQGSALNYLIDILSYATMYNNYYSSVAINELYLPYAQKNKNIYALANSLGYLPRRPSSSIAYIRPELPEIYNPDLTKDIVIPVYTKLKSQKGLNYILMEEIRFRYNLATNKWCTVKNNIFEPDDSPYYYKIKQGQFQQVTFLPTQQPLQRVFIDKLNIDNAHDSILVQDTTNYEYWTPFYDISDFNLDISHDNIFNNNVTVEELKNEIIIDDLWDNFILNLNSAKTFFLSGDEAGTYINFGDGTLGAIPENQMDILYILTEGENGNGDTIFDFSGVVDYSKTDGSVGTINLKNVNAIIQHNTSSTGGSKAETAESVRRLAPSFNNTQNREVTETDYEAFLMQQNSVQLNNVKCIGGEKLKPIKMGAIGICASKTTANNDIKASLLTDTEKELLRFILKNQNIVSINPIFIPPEFVRINIDTTIYYNPILYEDYRVFQSADSAIKTYFSMIQGFKKYFKSSNLISVFDKLPEIDHNLTTADLEYIKLIKKENIQEYMYINFGNNNPLMKNSITKTKTSEYFLKIFNNNTFYDWTEYDKINNQSGIFIKPDGVSSWDFSKFQHSSITNKSKIHKIFLYDLVEEYTDNSNVGNLYLVEKMPHKLKAVRINNNNDFPYFFKYEDVQETGKRKLIGEVQYNTGLIRLYLDNLSFRYLKNNKKSRRIAIETVKNEKFVVTNTGTEKIITYTDIDNKNDAYSDYDDIFFNEYPFDSVSNLPWHESPTPTIFEPNTRTVTDEFFLEFGFDTVREDFQSQGNMILTLGDWVVKKIKEVNKK